MNQIQNESKLQVPLFFLGCYKDLLISIPMFSTPLVSVPVDRVPYKQDLSLVPQRQTSHPTGKGSGVTACPVTPDPLPVPESSGITMYSVAPGTPPDKEWLRCRHVSCGSRPASRCGRALASPRVTRPATRQGRAPVLPCVPRLQTHLPVWKSSGVATCPMPPGLPPDRKALRCRHMSCGSRLASQCGRALASSCASWLLASEACSCIPKVPDIRLIMASPGTQSRQRMKCVQNKPYAMYG
jgi:hypothetical protein